MRNYTLPGQGARYKYDHTRVAADTLRIAAQGNNIQLNALVFGKLYRLIHSYSIACAPRNL